MKTIKPVSLNQYKHDELRFLIYRDYEIEEVYKYTDGTSDFEVFKGDNEHGTGFSKTTLDTVKQWIDGMTE